MEELTQMRLTWDDLIKQVNASRNKQPEPGSPQPWIVNGQEVYKCAKCKDTGWRDEHEKVAIDQNGKPVAFYRFATRCECVKLAITKQKLEKSGIDEKMNFANFDTRGLEVLEKAKEEAIKYADAFELIEHDRKNSIIFCGQVGAGKTHLGTAISRYLIDKYGYNVMYFPYRAGVTELKQLVTDDTEYRRELKKYAHAPVLFIDDMCKGKTTESDINIMYEILNYRYLKKLPCIISTEKTLPQIIAWDEAIGSRISEMCGDNVVTFTGRELNYRMH